MKTIQHYFIVVAAGLALAGNYSCQQAEGNQTGSEFIPDMAHSIAYEANVLTNYSLNTWNEESTFTRRQLSQPRLPVPGTIARGYTGMAVHDGAFTSAQEAVRVTMERMRDNNAIVYPLNGAVPYYYPDTEEGRTAAMQQIKYNPFPITLEGIARGQQLYNIYCGICHGGAGDGNGYLVRDGGKYPAQPANFLDSAFVNSSNGRYYHAIMFGKNLMMPYDDKLSYEERWQIIHYIRQLQAQSKKVKYDDQVNELNPDFGLPAALAPKLSPPAGQATDTPPQEEMSGQQQEIEQDQFHGEGRDH